METMAPKTNARAFQLKGSLFTLTVLQMLKADVSALTSQFTALAKQTPDLFNNMPIVIDLSKLTAQEETIDFIAVEILLRKHGLIPVGVRGGSATQHAAAIATGLPIMSSAKTESTEEIAEPAVSATTSNISTTASKKMEPKAVNHNTRLITQPVRSGQRIYAKGGDLVVLSSVSPGAELLADGHIHIYGALRGRALAGLSGDQEARIFCQSLEAELVSIAGHYWVNEDLKIPAAAQGVQIYLESERLHIGTF